MASSSLLNTPQNKQSSPSAAMISLSLSRQSSCRGSQCVQQLLSPLDSAAAVAWTSRSKDDTNTFCSLLVVVVVVVILSFYLPHSYMCFCVYPKPYDTHKRNDERENSERNPHDRDSRRRRLRLTVICAQTIGVAHNRGEKLAG